MFQSSPDPKIADPTVDDRVAPGTSSLKHFFGDQSQNCCMCCLPVQRDHPLQGIPADAVLLPLEEQQRVLEPFQGLWDIVPIPNAEQYSYTYTQAEVQGHKCTVSGGTYDIGDGPVLNARKVIHFKIFRSADGETTYIDQLGGRLESLDTEKGELVFYSAISIPQTWRRKAGGIVQQQPTATKTLGEELRELKELHDQGVLGQAEFESAKAAVLRKHAA